MISYVFSDCRKLLLLLLKFLMEHGTKEIFQMVNKRVKNCSTSLLIRKMQSETMGVLSTLFRTANVNKAGNTRGQDSHEVTELTYFSHKLMLYGFKNSVTQLRKVGCIYTLSPGNLLLSTQWNFTIGYSH